MPYEPNSRPIVRTWEKVVGPCEGHGSDLGERGAATRFLALVRRKTASARACHPTEGILCS